MKAPAVLPTIGFTLWLMSSIPAAAEDFTNALHAFLQQRVDGGRGTVCIVVGLVDQDGIRIVGSGKREDGVRHAVDGDTVFGIGSITKTFTALLLQDMIQHGEMKLDDSAAMYLPESVKMPALNGKQITLRQLVTHTSGLPANPSNLGPTWANYTNDLLYAFLSRYQLRHDPGYQYKYSNLGASLLGHVIALKAGTNYESLVLDRICRPLKLDSTRITLTPGLKARLVGEEDHRSPVFYPQGGLFSTANDLLKYVSAQLGLTQSTLTPAIERSHEVRAQPGIRTHNMGSWFVVSDPQQREFVIHSGDAEGYSAFVGFDERRRRGAVILSYGDGDKAVDLWTLLLESEWNPAKRPQPRTISSQTRDSFVGQYVRTNSVNTSSAPGIGIRIEGNKIVAQTIGPRAWPIRAVLPAIEGELWSESETRLFGRLSGVPLIFSRDAQGRVAGLAVHFGGEEFNYKRTSDHPPKTPELLEEPVAIKLETKLLDACAGQYEFAANGMRLTLRREGEKLVSQAWIEDDSDGEVDVYPQSETKFFDRYGNDWTFVKNDKREVIAVILHGPNFPNLEGRKLTAARK